MNIAEAKAYLESQNHTFWDHPDGKYVITEEARDVIQLAEALREDNERVIAERRARGDAFVARIGWIDE